MANFGQMLAASQAFLEPQKQKALAQSESEQKDFIIEGHDSDTLSEDLEQFYDVNKGDKK